MNQASLRALLFTSVVSCLAVTACDVEDESTAVDSDAAVSGDEDIGVAEQAFTYTYYAKRTSNGGLVSAALGPDSYASALMSVGGNLANNSSVGVTWLPGLGEMRLDVYAAPGQEVFGKAVTAGPAPMTATKSYNNTSTTSQAPWVPLLTTTNENYRCFLTSVSNYDGGYIFSDANDTLGTVKLGDTWYLAGVGRVRGSARCALVTDPGSVYNASSGETVNMGSLSTAGKWCWLRAVGGRFRTNNGDNGVSINRNTDLNRWELTVGVGKAGQAECNK